MPNDTTTHYLVWNDRYALGHETIDQQHQKIVAILNRLYEAVREGTEDEQTRPVLNELCRYEDAETHFAYEEALMAEIGYPEVAGHRRLHAGWTSETVKLKDQFQVHGGAVCHDTFLMAKKWWLGHTQGADRLYVPHLPR